MKAIHMVSWLLLVIGGLNWLLVVFGVDIARWGLPAGLVSVVYVLVGVSALIQLFSHKKDCKMCGMEMPKQMS